MRKLLQFPNHPAVVYLHWWSPSLNQGQRSFWRAPQGTRSVFSGRGPGPALFPEQVYLVVDMGLPCPPIGRRDRRKRLVAKLMLRLQRRIASNLSHTVAVVSFPAPGLRRNHTVQPETGLLAAYYGLPALSVRDVLFHRWARNDVGFRSRDIMCNQNHPNYLGHQYVPTSPCSCRHCRQHAPACI